MGEVPGKDLDRSQLEGAGSPLVELLVSAVLGLLGVIYLRPDRLLRGTPSVTPYDPKP